MKTAWNKVTPLSKGIALILFILLPFAGFAVGIQYGEMIGYVAATQSFTTSSTPSSTVSTATGNEYYSNVAEWQMDGNQTKFTVAYPIDFDYQDLSGAAAQSMNWSVGATTPGNIFFTLTIPSSFEPQTNFANATFTVGASANQEALNNCLAVYPNSGGTEASSTVMINSVPFTVFQSNSAGAGNLYQTTSYRAVQGGECWAIEYTIHSSQIANYPSSYNLQPFNQAEITTLLDRIAGTFTFK